jgi:hypothetical protein
MRRHLIQEKVVAQAESRRAQRLGLIAYNSTA